MNRTLADLRELDLPSAAGICLSLFGQSNRMDKQERLAILQILTSRITSELSQSEPRYWPIVDRAFELTLDRADLGSVEALTARINAMSVLLRQVEPRPGLKLLDPNDAVRCFFEIVPITASDAGRLLPFWQSQAIEDIRRMRKAKNLLVPLLTMTDQMDERWQAKLAEWSALLPQLP